MKKFFNLFDKKKKKFKGIILNDKYRILEAFEFQRRKYFMFDDTFTKPTGRAMSALTIYEELKMNADKEYLQKHCKAVDIILSDPKKIDIGALALIHNNLRERLEMITLPDYIYKLASVIFFDDSESPFLYDWKYNQEKIAIWKTDPDALIFFLKTPLRELIPYIQLLDNNAQAYFNVAEQVNSLHQSNLSAIISKEK